MKRVAQIAVGSMLGVAAVIAFLMYSLSASFSNWPFTLSSTHSRGSYRGITIGESKDLVFEQVATAQRQRKLEWVSIDEPGARTYADTFGSTALTVADRARVMRSDRWQANLPGCNCWAVLEFENNRLLRIVESRYHGPTK